MGKILMAAAALVFLMITIVATVVITGNALPLISFLFGPDHDFDPARAVAAPDYANESTWAALPSKADEADLVPAGIDAHGDQANAPVDAFFIHPTGYLRGASWNSPIDLESATEENTRWMLANQASAFNGCCRVYAPRYREVVDRNHWLAFANAELVIRHLVMPNHIECCTKPVLDFIASEFGDRVVVNIMDQYRPCYRAREYADIGRRLTPDEFASAVAYAQKLKLNFIT